MAEEKYWNKYYGEGSGEVSAPVVPSQFAAFVATEFSRERPVIVEIGCGNGRDSLSFAGWGFDVVGTDASSAAIDLCQSKAPENASFLCSEIEDPGLAAKLADAVGDRTALVYARFFIHAIDEQAEADFFRVAKTLCGEAGSVAVEFRTDRDEAIAKVTPSHYRRFVSPAGFLKRAVLAGFEASYFAEGFGYAKFRHDDAHVARFILKPHSG